MTSSDQSRNGFDHKKPKFDVAHSTDNPSHCFNFTFSFLKIPFKVKKKTTPGQIPYGKVLQNRQSDSKMFYETKKKKSESL